MLHSILIGFLLVGILPYLAVCERQAYVNCQLILDSYDSCTNAYDNETVNCTNYCISSFDGAINYIRKIHLDFNSCEGSKNTSEFCSCWKNSTDYETISSYLETSKWSYVFSNDANFAIFKDLLSNAIGYVNKSDVDANNTDSAGFCELYNWIPSKIVTQNNGKCFESIRRAVGPYNEANRCAKKYLKQESVKNFDNFLKCAYSSIPKDCNDNKLKRLFLLEVALLRPDVLNGDILSYFKNVDAFVQQPAKITRKRLFFLGYHFFIFAHKKDTYDKFCKITTNETVLFKNDYLTINGYLSSIGNSFTYLSGVSVVIKASSNVYQYMANQTSFSENILLNSVNSFNSTNNDTNIDIDIDLTGNNLIIFFKRQSTHILIGRWHYHDGIHVYHVFIRSTANFLSSSSGLLIDGCPQSSRSGRFKRADYSGECATSSADSDEPDLFGDICVDACNTDGNNTSTKMIQVVGDSSESIKNTDVDLVLDASASGNGNNACQLVKGKFEIYFCAIVLVILNTFIY